MSKNYCDHNHETTFQVRLLPTSSGEEHGNIIVCYRHYLMEIEFRRGLTDNQSLDLFPSWDSLKIYTGE